MCHWLRDISLYSNVCIPGLFYSLKAEQQGHVAFPVHLMMFQAFAVAECD